ncbi:hypothetical protein RsTz2092_04480 [Deferribacterales bacterium RsTz2092]|nr:hypothetical protein AGMMS49941_08750 [Deferribacterales bacterium]
MANSLSYKKILLFGTGAIGGYFGGMLSRSGVDVTFIARGARLAAMQANGLTLIQTTDNKTDRLIVKAQAAPEGIYDLIIISTKSEGTEAATLACKEHLATGGAVLSLQNGVDNVDKIAKVFGADCVVGGVIFSGISVPVAGVVRYEPRTFLMLGGITETAKQHDEGLKALFTAAGVKSRVVADIRVDMWRKLTRNMVINPLSALTGATMGQMWASKSLLRVMKTIAMETVAVANASNVPLTAEDADKVLILAEIYADYKTSMLQDAELNKPLELDGIMGVVAEASSTGKAVAPVSAALYDIMKFIFAERWHHTFPRLAADVIVYNKDKVLLIERKFEPFGWAIPGGMAELNEKIEHTAVRELMEETGVIVAESNLKLLGVYSEPSRDKRGHTVSVIYYVVIEGDVIIKADDDAANADFFELDKLPPLAFDHSKVLADFRNIFRGVV